MTETATVVCMTSELDVFIGSSGSLVPGTRAKIIGFDGKEITEYNQPGELLIQGPSVVLGYLNNERANAETFVWHDDGRWICTGDEVLIRKAPSGNEHLVIVDRIKELIKVKVSGASLRPAAGLQGCGFPIPLFSRPRESLAGLDWLLTVLALQGHQVAPAELEAHLLTHPAVSDCAVIQVPDEAAGEVPKAFVVRTASAAARPESDVAGEITKHVEEHKARHKWLKGGIEFVDVIPKSPSGKILRRLLRDREKEARRANGSKL